MNFLAFFLLNFAWLKLHGVLSVEHIEPWSRLENWTQKSLTQLVDLISKDAKNLQSIRQVSADCLHSLRSLGNGLKEMKIDAVKTIDAWGKVPNGILSGSYSSLGSYDQCLEVRENQYCLMFLNMPLGPPIRYSGVFRRYHQDHFNFSTATFKQFAYYANHFSGNNITIGICAPSSCSGHEIRSIATEMIRLQDLPFRVDVDLCQTRRGPHHFHLREIVSIAIVGFVLMANIYGSVAPKSHFASLFAFNRNVRKIFMAKRDAKMSPFLDGIKTLSMVLIIFGHSVVAMIPALYDNNFVIENFIYQPCIYLAHLTPFAIETFFLVTGYEIMGYFMRSQHELKLVPYLLVRWLRFIPTIGWFICLYILTFSDHVRRWVGGPFWHYYEAAGSHSEICGRMWISHILMIAHYFYWRPDTSTCLLADWYLEADYVFSILLLVVLIPFSLKRQNMAVFNCLTMILAGSLAIVLVAYFFDVQTTWIPFSFRSADFAKYLAFLHGKPWSHVSSYFVGVGMAMFISKANNKLSQLKLTFLWTLWWLALLMLTTYEAVVNFNWYPINQQFSLLYAAVSKLIWSGMICWIIFICHFGYAHPWVFRLLSWRGFRVFARLNLSALFVNIYLIRLRNATNRSTHYYSFRYLLFEASIPMSIYVYLISLINCALVEIPVINILKKVFLRSKGCSLKTSAPKCKCECKSLIPLIQNANDQNIPVAVNADSTDHCSLESLNKPDQLLLSLQPVDRTN